MPKTPVNTGFAAYHIFCYFLAKICAMSQQCYHTKSLHTSKSLNALYDCGGEILYKNGEHLDKGVIEKIQKDDK